MSHLAQLLDIDSFNYYDYGPAHNLDKYGQSGVPSIDLTALPDVPIALFVGNRDLLATVEDAQWLRQKLGDRVALYQKIEGGHISMLLGEEMSYFDSVL